MRNHALSESLDRVGIVLSSACAVHCAVLPAAAALLPTIGLAEAVPERVETFALLAAVVLAVASLASGCRHHRQWRPWLFLASGLGLIAAGQLLVEGNVWAETALVVPGALLIASAHLVNWRLCCAPRR